MKMLQLKNWLAVGAALLLTATASRVLADDQPATTTPAAKPEMSTYTGTVAAVDPNEHVLSVKGWLLHKSFNLGGGCAYTLLDKPTATATDLRPGEKVEVSYQNVHGVLIASRVEQQPMQYEGMVKAIDPEKHTLTLRRSPGEKELRIPDDCKIVLRDQRTGTVADIRTGDHVTVTYETPDGKAVARQIAQTSQEFAGTLTAIDLGEKTLKAKSFFDTKKFNVADNCAIVINGKPNGQLSDLRPDARFVFSYDEISGVNVVNRIAPADAPANASTPATPMAAN
ncbi:MAG TPA: DUF5666 domain-containing protein [bacterium]|nr:DUF5666 domain-containing protein [bacterium]